MLSLPGPAVAHILKVRSRKNSNGHALHIQLYENIKFKMEVWRWVKASLFLGDNFDQQIFFFFFASQVLRDKHPQEYDAVE